MSVGSPGVVRSAVGCGLYFGLLAVFSAGVAALLRSPVGTLSLLVPLFLSLGPLFGSLDATENVGQFLPDRAGQQILHLAPEGALGAWPGIAVMAGWAALAAAAGLRSLLRRDVIGRDRCHQVCELTWARAAQWSRYLSLDGRPCCHLVRVIGLTVTERMANPQVVRPANRRHPGGCTRLLSVRPTRCHLSRPTTRDV
ncbi:hypothetical protein [Streptomyces nigrescens]